MHLDHTSVGKWIKPFLEQKGEVSPYAAGFFCLSAVGLERRERVLIVSINGESRELSEESRVSDMLAAFKLDSKILVVEVNRTIIDKTLYDQTQLQAGDQIEIVHFVGGG